MTEGPSNAGTSTVEVEVAHNEDETDENTTTGDTTSGNTTVSDPGKSTAHNTERTVVVGHDHGNGVRVHKKTITIVVHSNMKGVIEKVSKNFRDYQKKVKLPGIDLKLQPVVTLPHVKADNPAKPCEPEKEAVVVTTSLVPSVVHSENSTQTWRGSDWLTLLIKTLASQRGRSKSIWIKTYYWSNFSYRRQETHHLPRGRSWVSTSDISFSSDYIT